MSRKTLWVLLGVFAVLCGVTSWKIWRVKPIRPEGPFPGDPVLAGLDLNQIAAFTVSSAGATSRVARKEGRWVVDSRFDYPADFRRIVEQLRSLADMKVGQVVQATDSDLGDFGLGPDQATAIQLEMADGSTAAVVRIGGPRPAQPGGGISSFPQGVYIRVNSGPVLLVDVPLGVTFGWTENWLAREIVNVSAEAVEQVTVRTPDESYTLRMPGPGNYVLEGLASNETVEVYNAGRLARALSPLTLLDVVDPAETTNDFGFGDASEVLFALRTGERYAVKVGGLRAQGGGRYVRLGVSYEKPPTPEEFEGVEKDSEEFKKRVEEFESQCAAAEQKAKETDAQLRAWTYVIPDYQAGNLTVRRSELVRTVEKHDEHVEDEESASKDEEVDESQDGEVENVPAAASNEAEPADASAPAGDEAGAAESREPEPAPEAQ